VIPECEIMSIIETNSQIKRILLSQEVQLTSVHNMVLGICGLCYTISDIFTFIDI